MTENPASAPKTKPEEPKKTLAPKPTTGSSDVEENKALAAISYIGILFIIPMAIKKDSAFAMYHAKQGMILFIFEVIIYALNWMPFFGDFLYWIGGLLAFVLFIIGLINALNGQTKPLPVIGSFAGKINV
ncbi:MAG: hypothetical protein Q7S37_04580 [bacterium]|nr:hypothetical protein [bacterium]